MDREMAERERLARRLHDTVAQDLCALGLLVDAATRRVADVDEHTARVLADVRDGLDRTIADVRCAIAELRAEQAATEHAPAVAGAS